MSRLDDWREACKYLERSQLADEAMAELRIASETGSDLLLDADQVKALGARIDGLIVSLAIWRHHGQ